MKGKTFVKTLNFFFYFIPLISILFSEEITVGAFYYPWWRPNFFIHTVAKPALWTFWEKEKIIDFRRFPVELEKIILIFAKYNTSIPQVAKNHIEQAQKGGIDLFALEWTGPYPSTVPNVTFTEYDIEKGFLPALRDFPSFKFCIFYDQTIRMFWKHWLTESNAYDFDNPKVRDTFLTDIFYISKKYFSHQNYFKINGKPVLWLYLTRLFKGGYEETLAELRKVLKGNVFIIADEIFSTHIIKEEKIKLFNAVGCYGLGIDSSSYHDGANSKDVVDMAIPVYENWRNKIESIKNMDGDLVKFIYPVQPQFDDDHLPNRPSSGEYYCESPEDFQYVCERIKKMIPSYGGIVFVTSFNEWYETTAVEECHTPSLPFRYNWGDSFLTSLNKVFKRE